jgi:hypothetical protein
MRVGSEAEVETEFDWKFEEKIISTFMMLVHDIMVTRLLLLGHLFPTDVKEKYKKSTIFHFQ